MDKLDVILDLKFKELRIQHWEKYHELIDEVIDYEI
jgi:hypothetical protein